jgi:hypothetical protein
MNLLCLHCYAHACYTTTLQRDAPLSPLREVVPPLCAWEIHCFVTTVLLGWLQRATASVPFDLSTVAASNWKDVPRRLSVLVCMYRWVFKDVRHLWTMIDGSDDSCNTGIIHAITS